MRLSCKRYVLFVALCGWATMAPGCDRVDAAAAQTLPPTGRTGVQRGTGGGSGASTLSPPSGRSNTTSPRGVVEAPTPSDSAANAADAATNDVDPARTPATDPANEPIIPPSRGTPGAVRPLGPLDTPVPNDTNGDGLLDEQDSIVNDDDATQDVVDQENLEPIIAPTQGTPGAVRPLAPIDAPPVTDGTISDGTTVITPVPGTLGPFQILPSFSASQIPVKGSPLPEDDRFPMRTAPDPEPQSRTPPLADSCRRVVTCFADMEGDLCDEGDSYCTSSFFVPSNATEKAQCDILLSRVPTLSAEFAAGRSSYDVPDSCR